MAHDFPTNAVKYSQSPVFTEATIPAALQRDHNTKPGIWGRIVVSSGALDYTRINRPTRTVQAGETATIYPEDLHHVAAVGTVQFQVEFYRVPQTEGEE